MENKKFWYIVSTISVAVLIGGITYVYVKSKKHREAKSKRNIVIINKR
jgi:hypothetical protein